MLPDEATQHAAQDVAAIPGAVPTNVSPEVEAEMREAATLLLVYNPEIDRLDPWKDLC